jgi:hypothetical protein
MISALRCGAVVCAALLAPRVASAQPAADEDGLRLSLGVGLTLVSGGETEVNGTGIGDPPTSFEALPTPVGLLRVDFPVHEHWLLGVQASAFAWDTTFEENLGYGDHLTFDVSALARLRFSFDRQRRNEVVASLAIGPSLDQVEGPSLNAGRIEPDVGIHLGVFVSYQLKPRSFPMGVFVDLGLTQHWLSQATTFDGGGRDEVAYEPRSFFVRVGAMFLPFR